MDHPTNYQGIVVLGMHRSGTSLAAKLVSEWGAFGNEAAMLGADPRNPDGYWEYAPLVAFNEELLRAVDSRWNVPPRDSHKELLEALANESDFRGRAIQLLNDMRVEGRPWFWKDPRLSVLLPFWKKLWGSVVYVVTTRDPSNIALSLESRNHFSRLNSFLLWERYLSELMAEEEIRTNACFISYELLLDQPRQQCSRLCAFLDERFGIQGPDQNPMLEPMMAAVKPGLWRSRGRSFLENPFATRAQKELFAATVRLSDGLLYEGSGNASLDSGWREPLELADHLLQPESPDRCQVFWCNSGSTYEERRSVSTSIHELGRLQSIELAFPPGQVQESISFRVDFSDRSGFLHLMDLTVRNLDGESVWSWDGRAESMRSLPRNQIELCGETASKGGCLLRFSGGDPWVEIGLNGLQSSSLTNGGSIFVGGTYLSTDDALVTIRNEMEAEIGALREKLELLRRAVGNNATPEL